MRMNFAWGIWLTIFSAMPSSGGLMKSSAELIQRTGAVMLSRCGWGRSCAGVDVVDEVVGVGGGDVGGRGLVDVASAWARVGKFFCSWRGAEP